MYLLIPVTPLLHQTFPSGSATENFLLLNLPWSVSDLLGIKLIPASLITNLMSRFHATEYDMIPLRTKAYLGRNYNAFLVHLSRNVISFLRFERLVFLMIERERVVHILHSLFLVLIGTYTSPSVSLT